MKDEFLSGDIVDDVLEFMHVFYPTYPISNMHQGKVSTRNKTYIYTDASQIKPIFSRNPKPAQQGLPDRHFPDIALVFVVSTGFQMDKARFQDKHMIDQLRIGLQPDNVSQT
jgi:hypothetical protein